MLPPRSKRFAGIDGRIERLHLIRPWQLVLVVLLLLVLFALIFPRRALLDELHQQEHFDELTLAYISNLRRVETGNDDLTLLLTRAQLEQMTLADAETALQPILQAGDDRLRPLAVRTIGTAVLHEWRQELVDYHGEDIRFGRMRQFHQRLSASSEAQQQIEAMTLWGETLLRTPLHRQSDWPALQADVGQLLARRSQGELPVEERLSLASLALHSELAAEADRLLAPVDLLTLREQLPLAARRALAHGQYETASALFLMARDRADSLTMARNSFRQGIAALMAAGLFSLALEAADRHLGDLAGDDDTLRFLVRTSLAAGDPQRAARYARQLVFKPAGGTAR